MRSKPFVIPALPTTTAAPPCQCFGNTSMIDDLHLPTESPQEQTNTTSVCATHGAGVVAAVSRLLSRAMREPRSVMIILGFTCEKKERAGRNLSNSNAQT